MSFNINNFSLSKSFSLTGAIALLGASVVLPACSNSPVVEDEVGVDETDVTEEVAVADENVQVDDLSDNVEAYLGQTVTVREEAEEIVGDNAFLLDEDELFGGEEVLVINASGEGIYLVEGDDTEVQATGEVRELVIADVEREYGLDLDPEIYADYETRPVIIAQSLALAPDPADLTDDPEQYYNQRIAFYDLSRDVWRLPKPGNPPIFQHSCQQAFIWKDKMKVIGSQQNLKHRDTSGTSEQRQCDAL
jgi:hypothetical protein